MNHHGEQQVGLAHAMGDRPDRQVHGHVESRRHRTLEDGHRVRPQPRQISGRLGHRGDHLTGHPIHRGEPGPQHLVPHHHVGEGRPQRIHVDLAGQSHDRRNVVGRQGRIELVDEPHPLLGERQRNLIRARHHRSHRRQRRRPIGHRRHQLPHRRRIKHIAHRHLRIKGLTDAGHQPHRRQRVTTGIEERLGHRHPLHTQDAGEHRRDGGFARPLGRGVVLGRAVGRRERQRRAIELAVGRKREPVDDHHQVRHHIARHPGAGLVTGLLRVDHCPRLDHQVSDQQIAAVLVADDPRRGPDDPVDAEQGLFDFPVLDTEAAQLDLAIGPAQVFDVVTGPAREVAGAVQPSTGPAERVGDEPGHRQFRPVEVSLGELGAGDVHFPDDPLRDRLQPVVEDVDRQRRQRPADVRGIGARHDVPLDVTEADMHRGLGDAVHVDQPGIVVGVLVEPPAHLLEAQFLTAEDDVAQRQLCVRASTPGIDQLVEGRRSQVQECDPLGREQTDECVDVPGQLTIHDDKSRTGEQRAPQLPHRKVECVGVEHGPHIVGAELEVRPRRTHQGTDVTMGHFHTLGTSGRSRRVNHVGPRRGQDRYRREHHTGVSAGQVINIENRRLPDVRPQLTVSGRRIVEHHPHTRIADDVGQPINRVRRIQRQICRAHLEHAHDRRDQIHRTRRGQADQVAAAHPGRDQAGRDRIRPLVQLGVRQRRVTGRHRPRSTADRDDVGEQVDQRPARLGRHRRRGQLRQRRTLPRGQHLEIADGPRRIGGHLLEHRRQPAAELVNRRFVKEFCGVKQGAAPRVTRVHDDRDVHVVLRGRLGRGHRRNRQVAHHDLGQLGTAMGD